MADHVIHISEAEAASDFAGLLARIRAGAEVVIENGGVPHPFAFFAKGWERRCRGQHFSLHRSKIQPTMTLWRRRTNSIWKIPLPPSTTKTRKPSPPSTKASGTLRLVELCLRRKPASCCPTGLPSPLPAKAANLAGRSARPTLPTALASGDFLRNYLGSFLRAFGFLVCQHYILFRVGQMFSGLNELDAQHGSLFVVVGNHHVRNLDGISDFPLAAMKTVVSCAGLGINFHHTSPSHMPIVSKFYCTPVSAGPLIQSVTPSIPFAW